MNNSDQQIDESIDDIIMAKLCDDIIEKIMEAFWHRDPIEAAKRSLKISEVIMTFVMADLIKPEKTEEAIQFLSKRLREGIPKARLALEAEAQQQGGADLAMDQIFN